MARGLRRGDIAMTMSLMGDEFGCDGAFDLAVEETPEIADEGHD